MEGVQKKRTFLEKLLIVRLQGSGSRRRSHLGFVRHALVVVVTCRGTREKLERGELTQVVPSSSCCCGSLNDHQHRMSRETVSPRSLVL